jgi:hypothetical protein
MNREAQLRLLDGVRLYLDLVAVMKSRRDVVSPSRCFGKRSEHVERRKCAGGRLKTVRFRPNTRTNVVEDLGLERMIFSSAPRTFASHSFNCGVVKRSALARV